MAVSAYVAESMTYYVAGLLDEDPGRDYSIESAIIKAYSRRAYGNAVDRSLKILGANAATANLEIERHIRDVSTLQYFVVKQVQFDLEKKYSKKKLGWIRFANWVQRTVALL